MADGTGPPRLALVVLRALLPHELRDAVEGDLVERYERHALPRLGRRKAGLWLWWEIARVRPWSLRRAVRAERVRAGTVDGNGRWGMAGWLGDLRQGVRGITRARGYAAVVVATMGVAVGATTLVFTIVDGVLLKRLPYEDPERLVQLWQTDARAAESATAALRAIADEMPASYPLVRRWGALASFSQVGGYARSGSTFTVGDLTRRVNTVRVDGWLFGTLGVQARLGRVIVPSDDRIGAEPVVVLSDGFWRDAFGGDPSALGRSLDIDGRRTTVVGVMPPTFVFPETDPAFWYAVDDEVRESQLGEAFMEVVARLAPGVSVEAANAELASFAEGLAAEAGGGHGARALPHLEQVVGDVRRTLLFLLIASTLVIAIASANVANLVLARGATRTRELAVRRALGAGTGRLVRLLFAETATLALAASLVAVGLARLSLGPVLAILPTRLPRLEQVAVDARTFAFAAGASAAVALVAGLAPAIVAGWRDVGAMLRDASRSSRVGLGARRAQDAIIAGEIALAFALFAVAGVLGRSLLRLGAIDVGFRSEGLAAVTVFAPAGLPDSLVVPLMEEAVGAVAALPGVRGVGLANQIPFAGGVNTNDFQIEGIPSGPDDQAHTEVYRVSPDYHAAMGIPLVRGRGFGEEDRGVAPEPVLVNEALVRRYFPDGQPLGRRVRFGRDDRSPWRAVVGVVGDVRGRVIEAPPGPQMFLPTFRPGRYTQIAVRLDGDADALPEQVRRVVHDVSAAIPVPDVQIMERAIRRSTAAPRFRAFLIGGLATLSVLLALAGVYALVSFSVASRRPEFGIRLALGASDGRIVREVVRQALRPGLVGIVAGALGAAVAARLVAGFLYEVRAIDPMVFVGASVSLATLVALASLLPARRASRVDPARVMDAE